jgi:hypothetical protein
MHADQINLRHRDQATNLRRLAAHAQKTIAERIVQQLPAAVAEIETPVDVMTRELRHPSDSPAVQDDDEMQLVPVQTVRVRFRDIGPLPPMDLSDEVGNEI